MIVPNQYYRSKEIGLQVQFDDRAQNESKALEIKFDFSQLFPNETSDQIDTQDDDNLNELKSEIAKKSQFSSNDILTIIYPRVVAAKLSNIDESLFQLILGRLKRIELSDITTSTFQLLDFFAQEKRYAKRVYDRISDDRVSFEPFPRVSDKLKSIVSQLIFRIMLHTKEMDMGSNPPSKYFLDNFSEYLFTFFRSSSFYQSEYIDIQIELVAYMVNFIPENEKNKVYQLYEVFILYLDHVSPSVQAQSLYGILFCLKKHTWIITDEDMDSERSRNFYNRLLVLAHHKNQETGYLICSYFQTLLSKITKNPERYQPLPNHIFEKMADIINTYLADDKLSDIRKDAISLLSYIFPYYKTCIQNNSADNEDYKEQINTMMTTFIDKNFTFSFEEKKESILVYANFFGYSDRDLINAISVLGELITKNFEDLIQIPTDMLEEHFQETHTLHPIQEGLNLAMTNVPECSELIKPFLDVFNPSTS